MQGEDSPQGRSAWSWTRRENVDDISVDPDDSNIWGTTFPPEVGGVSSDELAATFSGASFPDNGLIDDYLGHERPIRDSELFGAGHGAGVRTFGSYETREPLDTRFRRQARPKDFFRVGRVFKVLWPEPAGFTTQSENVITMDQKYAGGSVYVRIRWFVVIMEGDQWTICLPISTYAHRGLTRRGVKTWQYSVIHTGQTPPDLRADEIPPHWKRDSKPDILEPIQVACKDRGQKMHPVSRLHYAKMYTLEHNVKVFDFGMVVAKDIATMQAQWRQVLGWMLPQNSKSTSRIAEPPYFEDFNRLSESVSPRTESFVASIIGRSRTSPAEHAAARREPKLLAGAVLGLDSDDIAADETGSSPSSITSQMTPQLAGHTSTGTRTPYLSEPSTKMETEGSLLHSDPTIASTSASSGDFMQIELLKGIAVVLLAQHELVAWFDVAITKFNRQEVRDHLCGLLKQFGRNLLKKPLEAEAVLARQVAQTVQQCSGRIAEDLCWIIADDNKQAQPAITDTPIARIESESPVVESSSSVRHKAIVAEHNQDRILAGDADIAKLRHELLQDLQPPQIEEIKTFLLNSEALQVLTATVTGWAEVGHYNDDQQKQTISPAAEPAVEDFRCDGEGVIPDPNANVLLQRVLEHPSTSEDAAPPEGFGPWLTDLITRSIDSFANQYLICCSPDALWRAPSHRHMRLYWKCSCYTNLWADFVDDEVSDLKVLVQDLSSHNDTITLPSTRPDEASSHSVPQATTQVHAEPQSPSMLTRSRDSRSSKSSDQSHQARILESSVELGTHTINVKILPKFFEVCINIGNHEIRHQELDITDVTTDAELFSMIWQKYNASRGIGFRRLFLKPRNVHFVLFSVNRASRNGVGIHKKPNEFPPLSEVSRERYHYLCPKVRMPVNIFLHYLHEARWSEKGKHEESIWLRRLPKKLNKSVIDEIWENVRNNDPDDSSELNDEDLAFGWGIHILDGPNHAVLGVLLAIGLVIAFAISGMVVGFAKTQEQGFGIGSFLLSVMTTVMAAVYFQLQDM